ncbi:eukaryotic translation initiation factor 4 gamma 1a isoform X2 [Gouania willdenowi]|uniref:eukaryotic translation initiation factor 4 gamma 1a isoform X2 n=1 Tax=Gouania willdenowi TaxID=441366 RepID=UPI001056C98D|nr:eukaryotic translation initiation factor 4 gamma 1-like isoform X2 [Gouania willdenowi]
MNKPPQPITGPTSVPNPSPSPGLTQAAYGPGQPPSLVFATPPPQMNSTPQPRQFAAGPRTLHQQGGYRALQNYYQNRPAMAASAPRVQTSSGPRPVGPTHVYPTSSPMMMISQQQLPFAGSPQGYFIPPGQYRAPYMPPTQQYPVTTGSAGFYPGTSPAEYPGYGAYYPAQPQYPQSVQPAPVMINPAQQQPQAPPPQQPPTQPQGPPKRERKQIRIRDPNQGGRDITEEIMSGGRSTTTPTPPQTSLGDISPPQTNGEVLPPVTALTSKDENAEFPTSCETPPPPPATAEPELMEEAKQDMDEQIEMPADFTAQLPIASIEKPAPLLDDPQTPSPPPGEVSSSAPVEALNEVPVSATVCDTVDAPVRPSESLPTQETAVQVEEVVASSAEKVKKDDVITEELKTLEKEEQTPETYAEPAVEVDLTVSPVNVEEEEIETKTEASTPPSSLLEPDATQLQESDPISDPEPLPVKHAEPALSNGLPQESEDLSEDMKLTDTKSHNNSDISQTQEPTTLTKTVPLTEQEEEQQSRKEKESKKSEEIPPIAVGLPEEPTMQVAMSVPKKKKNMKELNKKAIGDLLDAFTEEQQAEPAPEPMSTQASPPAPVETPAEVPDETWEEKEDKQNAQSDRPSDQSDSSEKKYNFKEDGWKPINPEDKKQYDREFLLSFQFINASMHKPEGLPLISDVVLDKANKTPLRPADPARVMNAGPDFTPSYLGNLGSRSVGGPRGPPPGPRRSQQGQRKEPRKIIINSMSLNDDVQLNKAEKAWKPTAKKSSRSRGPEEVVDNDPEVAKTEELFKRLRSILNKLTPQKFQELMKQVSELTIDTEERLKGAIDLIFEKAISEPNFSVAYANMCRCLMGLKVPSADKPGETANFRYLLLNRCQKEFEKDQDDDEIFEKKQKELEAAKDDEERDRLQVELKDARDIARRRSLGNIKFIGELFKLKMLTEAIMHACVVKLLKNHDEESLECLCRLLSTIGKDLDFEKAKPRMDQYFNQMNKIINERKTSSRIRFMLQDVIDLRKSSWVPRRGDQGPKTIDQIHKEAELEEHREQIKVHQQLLSKKESSGGGGRMGGGGMGGRGSHTPGGGRNSQPQDEGWNTVPISKNRPIDTNRLCKITKSGGMDLNNQLLAPGGKGMWGSWGKGSSGGTGAKPASTDQESGRPATSTLNRFSALQQSSSLLSSSDTDRRVPQRSSSSRERGDRERGDRDRDRFDRFGRVDGREGNPITKRSFSRESQERGGRSGDNRPSNEPVRRVASMTDSRDRGSRDRGSRDRGSRDRGSRDRGSRDRGSRDRGSRDRGSRDRGSRDRGSRDRGSRDQGSRDRAPVKDLPAKRESAPTPPPSLPNPSLSEEEMEKKSKAIIDEYLHITDLKEALQCVAELNSASMLYVFVRQGLESTLERSTTVREHLGLLLYQLVKVGTLPTEQYYKGLQEILEVAEDMAIDIPHMWLYLAELITPMLHEGGIPMGQLFREISKPLVPLGKAGVLLAQILQLLCKGMTPKKVGALWIEAGLDWNNFLLKDEDVNKFVTEQKVEFTTGEDLGPKEAMKKQLLSGEELSKQLDRLLQDKADNKRIMDWVEANLDEEQAASNQFVRSLMASVCGIAIICDNPYKVNAKQITLRAELLQKYLNDEEKELQALYALQALMVHMEQPANLLRMFFDTLYDEDVIKEEAFYKWEASKDPAEQTGKGVALKSVTAFFTWLREPEDESDKE